MAIHKTGVLIAVEGIDGAGKTTLVHELGIRLKEHVACPVVVTKEPGGTPLGLQLRELLQHQEMALAPQAECLLFMADRAQHFAHIVIPALANGAIVLSDRMGDSSLAYQSYGRGHDSGIITMLNQWTMHGILPNCTLYLKIPVDLAYERMRQRKAVPTAFEQQGRFFMERVARGFDSIYAGRTDVKVLDATSPHEAVIEQAYTYVVDYVKNHLLTKNIV
jgi:dTMP kinase